MIPDLQIISEKGFAFVLRKSHGEVRKSPVCHFESRNLGGETPELLSLNKEIGIHIKNLADSDKDLRETTGRNNYFLE